jgi:hypothetical protein
MNTQQLSEQFRNELLKRKNDLERTKEILSLSDEFVTHIKNIMKEVDRIDAIVIEIDRIDFISKQ